MIIRCERCSTLYDLDETLLAPEGSQVQCTRCEAIFLARPPRPAGSPSSQAAPPPPAAGPAPSGPPASARPTEPRPARSGPSIYRRPAPAPSAAPPPAPPRARPGAPARDAIAAMEARLRSVARWKLAAIPAAAALVLLLLWGGWSAWKRRPDPETERQRTEARALIAQDDAASLARALELLDAIRRGGHPSRGADGERGLARALVVAAMADEIDPLLERLASAGAEKARLERERPAGYEDAARALAMEATRLEVELAPKRQKLEALRSSVADDLGAVALQPKGAIDAARGQAVLAVLESNGEEVGRQVGRLRVDGPDPWADVAELWLATRRDAASRDQAIPRLVTLTGSYPELIRARYILARALQQAGRREEAISALGRLLAANPRHERAQRLRSLLSAPATATVAPPPPQPPPRPVLLPRPAQPPSPAAANLAGPPPAVPVATPATAPAAAVNQPAAPPPAEKPAPLPEVPLPPQPVPQPPRPRPAPEPMSDPTAG